MPVPPVITFSKLSFTWPDGAAVLADLDGVFGVGRTGLVGNNGAGKSTLLRLIAGQLSPTGGSVHATGPVAYLRQRTTPEPEARLIDLLGFGATFDAITAVEGGSCEPELFDQIGNDWDLCARAVASLAEVGLPTDLTRPAAELSGGESSLAALIGVRLARAPITLLDEPTNNLDRPSRLRVHQLIDSWRGSLVVVSHDAELLEMMDATAELRAGRLTNFGGPYSAWLAALEADQLVAAQTLRTATQQFRAQQRQASAAEVKIAGAKRKGKKDLANRRILKVVANDRRNSAERSAGTIRARQQARLEQARAAVEAAEQSLRQDERIRVDLPPLQVPAGRRLAVLRGSDGREFVLQGADRVGLTGVNGVGKSTLIGQLFNGQRKLGPTAVALSPRLGLLRQADDLDDRAEVLGALHSVASAATETELRNRLARFRLRGEVVRRPIGSLSGGERFRLALAMLLLADPPAELLVLDEPTNGLDAESVTELTDALASYQGALLVVSHESRFLERLQLGQTLELLPDGRLVPLET